eukprot:TRINITY_DN18365_c0_g1_i2.p1 TRINITY_DN18365_c0_g1~~TRINITY_DN18365_c0_g1_i2.p1  ORF type:complete len:143 (+),score=3.70 TRINITY_DN18365_c0_g1_i2:73-501(+)
MIRRPPRSTLSSSSAASDVYKRQVRIPPVRLADRQEPAKIGTKLIDQLEAAVLYEDDDLIVVNKPSGIAVHGGSGISLGLIESFRQMRPQAKFLELVHRLDRDTSGCILLAKKRSALKLMHCLLYTSPSPRDRTRSRMPSSA